MNAFTATFERRCRWDHLEDRTKPDVNSSETLQLKRHGDVFHLCDETGEKVYLVVSGEAPSEDPEVLLQTARALENQLLHEENTRLPVY